MPTRPTSTRGVAWRSACRQTFHHVLILPYIGAFKYPQSAASGAWSLDGPPVPRIHLNHISYEPSKARRRLWSREDERYHLPWTSFGNKLELTVAVRELVDFVPWVVAQARAMEADDPGLIAPPPHPLEFDRTPDELMRMDYAWTMAASADYWRRMWYLEKCRRERVERARQGEALRQEPGNRARA